MAILLSREIPLTTTPLISSIAEIYGSNVVVGQKDSRDHELFASYTIPSFLNADRGITSLAFILSQFPPDFFRSLDISTIKLADLLTQRANKQYPYGDHAVSGVMDQINGRLYTVTDGLKEVVPHEVTHRLIHRMDRIKLKRLKKQWNQINDRYGLEYKGFSSAFNNEIAPSPSQGFVSMYSETAFSEDVPEVISFIFSNPFLLMKMASAQEPIAEKTDLAFNVLDDETNGLFGKSWQNSIKNGEPLPFMTFLGDKSGAIL